MIELRGVLRLASEAKVERRITREVGAQHLDRDVPVEQEIASEVHLRHPAEPERLAQFVAVGEMVRGRGHRLGRQKGGQNCPVTVGAPESPLVVVGSSVSSWVV